MRTLCILLCAACALLVCGECAASDAINVLAIGPYVQDVQADGFTVMCETVAPAHVTVTAEGQTAASDGTHHVLRLRGLTPRSRARYELRVDGNLEGGGTVALPDATRPLTFLVYGDTRDNAVGSRLTDLARSLAPDLILHTGDLVHLGGDVKYWYKFFRDEAPLLADVPLYATLGNHEVFRDAGAVNFQRFFTLPAHPPQKLYYVFDFGPARFLVLDGNHVDAAQTRWLADELERTRRDGVAHVFVLIHQPPLSVGAHCGDALAQADWVELFERYRVRAVFAGHDHAYERLERNGVRYFVSGGGGAELYPETSCAPFDRAAVRVYQSLHHLLRVRVRGPEVTVDVLPVDDPVNAVAAPLETLRFAAGEPMFAADAPALRPDARTTAPWSVAGGFFAFVLVGVVAHRRLRRTR